MKNVVYCSNAAFYQVCERVCEVRDAFSISVLIYRISKSFVIFFYQLLKLNSMIYDYLHLMRHTIRIFSSWSKTTPKALILLLVLNFCVRLAA